MTSARLLYWDPWGGASGDMVLAALVDCGIALGSDLEPILSRSVEALGLDGVRVQVERTQEHGHSCLRVGVVSDGAHPLRTLEDLESILCAAGLSEMVVENSRRAVRRLAEVEARIHSTDPERVVFHELSGVDTLVDVTGCFVLMEALGVSEVVHGTIPLGSGRISTAHGEIGIPAPATLRLLEGRPVCAGAHTMEATTPTGALLLAETAHRWGPLPPLVMEGAGYGAGARRGEVGPNLLRAVVGRPLERDGGPCSSQSQRDRVVMLQTVVDDASPETIGYVQDSLRAGGALETWWTAVGMKKSRPGIELTCLVHPDDEEAALDVIFGETPTFGVRRSVVDRHVLERTVETVSVEGRPVRMKVGRRGYRITSVSAEYEDAAAVAKELGKPLCEVMQAAADAARSPPS